jgi:hypothetical protein
MPTLADKAREDGRNAQLVIEKNIGLILEGGQMTI